MDKDELYVLKYDFGLYTLQKSAIILAFLLTAQEEELSAKVKSALSSANIPISSVKRILQEQYDMILLVGSQTPKQSREESLLKGLLSLL